MQEVYVPLAESKYFYYPPPFLISLRSVIFDLFYHYVQKLSAFVTIGLYCRNFRNQEQLPINLYNSKNAANILLYFILILH